MSPDDASALDVLNAARRASQFIAGLTEDDFLRDVKTQSAVIHQLLLVGEATKRLSASFRAQHATIAWKGFAGLRDRLIHAYDRVDLLEVLATVRADLPLLIRYLESRVPTLPPGA